MTTVELLKKLTQNTYDSVAAYREAAEKTESKALEDLLRRRTGERTKVLNRMNDALEERGESRIIDASVSGYAKNFMNSVTAAFVDGDEAAAKQVEKAEDELLESFSNALKSQNIDTSVRMLIETAYRDIREGERVTDMLEKQYA